MQFVLNTSFDPHFCALFDEHNQLVVSQDWLIPREDGSHIWQFLKDHLPSDEPLTFIGGVSGPGSFSSLRTAGTTLNALAFKFELPIHQVRADKVVHDYLQILDKQDTPFLLNSFSQRVFWPQSDQLKIIDLAQEVLPSNQAFITTWLPESKRTNIKAAADVEALGPLQTILKTLQTSPSSKGFIPDYEYPPVQS